MTMMDTRSERSTLATVTAAAFEHNGWDVLAVARTNEPDQDNAAAGVVAFVYTAPHEGRQFGTAYWTTGLRVNFDWGHYDLTYDDAMEDFQQRVGRSY